MKVVVLGAGGMLGHKVLQTLAKRFPGTIGTIAGTKQHSPVSRLEALRDIEILEGVEASASGALAERLAPLRPDVLVNCIGVIKQRAAAYDPIPSITINALFPHQLARMATDWNARVIHFSTDCVFSGRRGRYTEEDLPDAEDLYGRTKFLGEVAAANSLTLRTSIIGRELENFQSLLEWFLAQKAPIRGFTNALYSGVTTNHLAQLVGDLIATYPKLSGLYQVASAPISKYDLLCLIREAYGRNVEIVRDDSFVCDRSMLGDKLFTEIGYRPPPWPQLVAELANDPTSYERQK